MSITSPQEVFRRPNTQSQETVRPSSSPHSRRFKELLEVEAIDEKLHEKKEEEKMIDGLPSAPLAIVFSNIISPSSAVAGPSSILSAEMEALFEKMASSMIIMSSSGETETTLLLDNPSSMFNGTKITIREFSTAPKAFNVEITSFSPAIQAIDASKNDLLSAFQNGKFNFSIHRFETHLKHEERPVFHRKESDQGSQEEKGGRDE